MWNYTKNIILLLLILSYISERLINITYKTL